MEKELVCIVTGCTGYVGNVLTKKLLQEHVRVIGLARDQKKVQRVFQNNLPEKIVYGDILNKKDLSQLFPYDDVEYVVIHTVAYVTIGEGNKKDLFDITVQGTQNIIDEAIKHPIKKFLQISSTEAISKKVQLNEDLSNYIPSACNKKGYSLAKSQADEVVLKAVKSHDLNASLLLLAGVLGPGDYSYTHMTQVMCDFFNGKLPASIHGGYNDFDIRDLADVLLNIINNSKKGKSYVFANKPDKINEVLEIIAKKYNKKMPPTLPLWVAYIGLPFLYLESKIRKKRPLYTLSSLASLKENTNFPIKKSEEEFGYHPRPLRNTVCDHMEFLKEIGEIKE